MLKRIVGGLKAVKPAAARKIVAASGRKLVDLSGLQLPTEPNEPEMDIRRYSFLVYGREGIGKSTWLSSFPDIIFVTAELGIKGLRVYEWNHEHGGTTSWPIFLRLVEILETDPGRFKNVAVDTIDRLHDMCSDYICRQLGIARPGVDADGEKDWGASYRAINKEFTTTMDRILRAGLGLFMVSHVRETTVKQRSGPEYNKMCASIADSPRRAIEAYSDFIFFLDWAKDGEGRDARVIITTGDDSVTAKARRVGDVRFPKYLPLTEEGGYEMLEGVVRGEDHGLDPKTLLPSNRSTKAGRSMLQDDRTRALTRSRKVVGKGTQNGGA
jgi:hypothetical protein